MLINEVNHPKRVNKSLIENYVTWAINNEHSVEARAINPKHVIEWIFELLKGGYDNIFKSSRFKYTFYALIKSSKYPMSLFLKLSCVERLANHCENFDTDLFEDLFNLFLDASKQHCTNPRGMELIKNLPNVLPNDRTPYKGWFLTLTNECFKMLSVIDFYIWLYKQGVLVDMTNNAQVEVIEEYNAFMKNSYSRGKYKKKESLLRLSLKLCKERRIQ